MVGASSSSGGSFKYDVFINFRGEDTRRGFVCHLYKALKALNTFIDSEELRKGDDLSELLKAIQESRLSIVVFSKNYASSTWCLNELVQILECMDRQSQIVVPVFYDVDPSHVRKLKESFAEAFAKHESDSIVDKEELESWKSSLIRAANLSGYDSRNYQDDAQLIESIVDDILKKVICISPSKTDGLIGMDSHMNEIDSLFKPGVDDCHQIVGIWGMGGIGKSTIARAVYDKYSSQFDHKCFLEDVKEGFLTKNGGKRMLKDLLSKILKIKDPSTLDGGLDMMRNRLGERKILLVLDDVDKVEQIDTLIGENPSFGVGSRIIITTRDKNMLTRFLVYEPKVLTTEKALELFRRYAFRTIKSSESYVEISRRAVKYAHGLPLALKVLGVLLDNKTVYEWEYELKKIKKISISFLDDNKIGRVLLASYNGLDEWQKNIFLDIACFFKEKREEDVTRFHESCGFFPQNGLRVLEERSLVTFSSSFMGRKLKMHDLIQEMGRDIVYQESSKDPGRRSRLWYYEDVLQVLSQNTQPTEAVEGIILDFAKLNELCVSNEAFVGMKRLRLLQLTYRLCKICGHAATCKQQVSGDLKFLSNELRVLEWQGCPLKSLPYDFQPKNLIKIDMCGSHIEQLWEGAKPLPNLVHMNLSGSKYLIKTPDLTKATNLKELNLEGCTSLSEVHPSISALESLVELNLHGCSSLKKFPNISGNMKELNRLWLSRTANTEMPSSVSDLPGLECLILDGCRELRRLPSSIHMKSLTTLDLSDCSKLEEFPDISQVMAELSELNLDGTAIKELPSSIKNLTGLESLIMSNCTCLVSLPDEICDLELLASLDLRGCSKLEKLPDNFHNWESFTDGTIKQELLLAGSGIKQLPFGILRKKSLSCKGWKELTAPFSSWPTCMSNPSSSVLVRLDLSDCNLLEISDAIAHLSSLTELYLSGNSNLKSLPEAMNRLGHLRKLYLEGCKGLKSIPELSSSIEEIKADNCTSLETVSTPQLPCVGRICFTFFNCLKLVNTNLFMDIVEAAVADNQGEDSDSDYDFDLDDVMPRHYCMSLPGSEIPDWFNHQGRGSSVTVQLPPDWSIDMCEGFAICAITNVRVVDYWDGLVCCATFIANEPEFNFNFNIGGTDVPLESDHMILGYINISNAGNWPSGRKYTQATFRIVENDFTSSPRYPKTREDCSWITSCGVRLLHKNPAVTVDLICTMENRETEVSRKRKRETLEADEETMEEEVLLSGCSLSGEREVEGVAGLESEEADVSREGGLLTLSL